MKRKIDYTLYLCTDRGLMSSSTVEESVEKAILGGVTIVQLREKDCSSKEFYQIAQSVKAVTDKYNVPLIINDRLDIAMAINADGVHLGQSDLPAKIARQLLGKDKIIGVSAGSKESAQKAQADGADYIGVGAMYATNTKDDAKVITVNDVKEIRESVTIPMVVIGGINKTTIPNVNGLGIDGICVISAIVAQPDITKAAQELKEIFKK